VKGHAEFDSSVNASRQDPVCLGRGIGDLYFIKSTVPRISLDAKRRGHNTEWQAVLKGRRHGTIHPRDSPRVEQVPRK